jgi:hypothetical protein
MKSYSVTVAQWITFNIEAENETEAENEVIEGEAWMPNHTGDSYDCEVTVEEND